MLNCYKFVIVNCQVQLFLDNMVLANQNAKLTGPDQGFLVSPLVPSSVPGPHGWHCVAGGPGESQNEKWFDWSHENNGMRKLNTNLY
jgi:hypothetical protein